MTVSRYLLPPPIRRWATAVNSTQLLQFQFMFFLTNSLLYKHYARALPCGSSSTNNGIKAVVNVECFCSFKWWNEDS